MAGLIPSRQLNAAAQRYFQMASRARNGDPGNIQLHRFSGRTFFAPKPGVRVVEGATVLSGEWFVLDGQSVLCDFFVQTPFPPFSAYVSTHDQNGETELVFEPPRELPIREAFL